MNLRFQPNSSLHFAHPIGFPPVEMGRVGEGSLQSRLCVDRSGGRGRVR